MSTTKTARAHRKFAIYSTFLDVVLEGEEEIAEGETRKDTLKRILKDLEETASDLRIEYESMRGMIISNSSISKETPPDPKIENGLKDAILAMQKIQFKEDAEIFLTTEKWMKYNKELKSLLNAKPNKLTVNE